MGLRNLMFSFFDRLRQRKSRLARKVAGRLRLDDDQTRRLHDIEETIRVLHWDLQEGRAYRRGAVLALLSREQFDREEALRLARLPMAMVNDGLPRAVERFGDFYDALTADQRSRLREWLSRRFADRVSLPSHHGSFE